MVFIQHKFTSQSYVQMCVCVCLFLNLSGSTFSYTFSQLFFSHNTSRASPLVLSSLITVLSLTTLLWNSLCLTTALFLSALHTSVTLTPSVACTPLMMWPSHNCPSLISSVRFCSFPLQLFPSLDLNSVA